MSLQRVEGSHLAPHVIGGRAEDKHGKARAKAVFRFNRIKMPITMQVATKSRSR